jgi:osmoprotectant transport system permease protein
MSRLRGQCRWLVLLLALAPAGCRRPADVRVGSKAFPESEILGELARDLAASTGLRAEHRNHLGDTSKVWTALLLGEIDAYCEYTGTLSHDILTDEHVRTDDEIRRALAAKDIRMSRSLGFSDNYALGMREDRAAELGIRTISDLKKHPNLRLGLSHQFLDRADGWRGVRRFYELPFATPNASEHSLAYQALANGTVDVVDVYTTDAQVRQYHIRLLEDDRHFFPAYDTVLLYRADLEQRAPEAVRAMLRLEGAISADEMLDMNARVVLGESKVSDKRAAADFLAQKLGVHVEVEEETRAQRIWLRTRQHLLLVVVSLTLAIAAAVPLGVAAARQPHLGQALLALVGVVQTLPALALLGLLILWVHQLGALPAIIALFLYSLLPIVRNTYAGLHDIPPQVRESARALGLSRWARLRLVELPMASRAILAGIKTAAVINVGYATLGGLIGAGGYGQPIITGLDRNDHALILEGAIPAVVMALAVQALFEVVERVVVPRGLRLEPAR